MKLNEMLLTVGLVAVGVILAGYVMNHAYDVPFIGDASDGFDK